MSVPWLRNGTTQKEPAVSAWTEHVASDNRVYYWNAETKTSSWEKPDALKSAEEKQTASGFAEGEQADDWKEYETPEGQKYYHNHITNVTTWDKPTVLVAADAARKADTGHKQQLPARLDSRDLEEQAQQELERLDRINVVGSDGKAISAAMYALSDDAVPVFKSPELAEEAFQKLLRRSGVQTDWTWDQAMRAGIKDPVWRALPSAMTRKSAFERYVIDLKKATIGKQKDRVEKLKKDFEQMLRRHDELKSYSQFNNVKANLEGEIAYKAAIDDEEREALFDTYTEKLEHEEKEQEKDRSEKAMLAFSGLLETLQIDLTTTWKTAQVDISQNEVMSRNPQLQGLRKVDMLLAFEQYVKEKDRRRVADFRDRQSSQRRRHRENRRAFVHLLRELRSAGSISAGTKWKEVFRLIKDAPAFQSLVGQVGSSPMDFFWDIRDEMDQELRGMKSMILDVLDARKETVSVDTTFEHFTSILNLDNRTSHIGERDATMIFTQLQDKAQKKADEERKTEERRVRRKQDDLRSAMKKLDPPIGVNDTYEAVRIRISMLAEFTALESESAREGAFNKYIRRLKERMEEEEERAVRRERHARRHSPARRHNRDRRSSRDSRRSVEEDGGGGHDRRRGRSERRDTMDHGSRSPKRPRIGNRPREPPMPPGDESMLDYGDGTEQKDGPLAIDPSGHVTAAPAPDGGDKGDDDSSEDGEIAE